MGGCNQSKRSGTYTSSEQEINRSKNDHSNPNSVKHLPSLHSFEPIFDCDYGNSCDEVVTCGDDRAIQVLNWVTGKIIQTWNGHDSSVNKVLHSRGADSKDAPIVVTASRDTTIRLWERDSEMPINTLKGHEMTVTALTFNEEEKQLISGSRDCSVRIWDIETSKQLQVRKTPRNLVTCMKWMNNTTTFIQGSEDLKLRVWDTRDRSLKSSLTIDGYVYFPLALDVEMDGNHVFTTSKGFDGVGCEGRMWDIRAVKQIVEFTGHQQDTTGCSFVNSTQFCVSVSKDKTIKVWNTITGVCVCDTCEIDSKGFTAVTVVPATNRADLRIVASSFSGKLYIYSLEKDGKLQLVAKSD